MIKLLETLPWEEGGSSEQQTEEEYDHGLQSQKGEDEGNVELFVYFFTQNSQYKKDGALAEACRRRV